MTVTPTMTPATIARFYTALRGETPVRVRFTKKNGDGAEAMLTWNESFIPAGDSIPPTNKSYVKAYCVERKRWTTITFEQMGDF